MYMTSSYCIEQCRVVSFVVTRSCAELDSIESLELSEDCSSRNILAVGVNSHQPTPECLDSKKFVII